VIIRHAIDGGASDIHIEPSGDKTRIRYRIDGILGTSLVLPSYIHSAVVARIKILANLKMDESRIPQDGRIKLIIDNSSYDFRISTMPLSGKEKVVMRIFDTENSLFTLEQLGFNKKHRKQIDENMKRPNGLILITGPTGSGKSTTLHSILKILNRESVNIITLEDPVEYTIDGVNQSQVNHAIKYTFATGLRAILRQDPDIIMVGEIRDNETAELAIHAALTGHMVLSTLHTNDAVSSIPRLLDMNVEPFLLAATLNIIVAQRLVRRICDNCKEEIAVSDSVENKVKENLINLPIGSLPANIDLNSDKKLKFYKGKGCSKCGNTGYIGRCVIAQNMVFMNQDGYIKALQGMTTIEEIMRLTND